MSTSLTQIQRDSNTVFYEFTGGSHIGTEGSRSGETTPAGFRDDTGDS
ncbi:MAG: hypothetical protein NT069_27210 [Planctomycetota bacterium]|nr:hypothetical protein [Planctomycetota bacterium]